MNWYFNFDAKPQGPITEADMRELIRTGRVGPETLTFIEGVLGDRWQPARERSQFKRSLFPAFQLTDNERGPVWNYIMEGRIEGPVTFPEIKELVLNSKLSLETLIWRPGLTGWCQFMDRWPVEESADLVSANTATY